MQTATIFLSLAVLVAVAVARPEEKYTDKYDNIDVDEILRNERLQKPFIDCLLKDNAKCSREGAELKAHIPDALTNNCGKCTEIQKQQAEKVIQWGRKEKPEVWEALKTKYDPEGKWEAKYSELYKDKV